MHRLLVVDDELDVCDFVKSFFEERNYEVVTALDGEDAVKILKRYKFDVVLLDVKMKKMGGLETLKGIRAIGNSVKVIMVTAVDDETKIERACELGACRYITKPLVLEELERVVNEVAKHNVKVSPKGKKDA